MAVASCTAVPRGLLPGRRVPWNSRSPAAERSTSVAGPLKCPPLTRTASEPRAKILPCGLACMVKSFHRQAAEPGGLGPGWESRELPGAESGRRSAGVPSKREPPAEAPRTGSKTTGPGQASSPATMAVAMLAPATMPTFTAVRRSGQDTSASSRLARTMSGERGSTSLTPFFVLPCPSRTDEHRPGTQRPGCEEISHQTCTSGWVQSAHGYHEGLLGMPSPILGCAGVVPRLGNSGSCIFSADPF